MIQNYSKIHSIGYRKYINPNISTSDVSRLFKFSYISKTIIIYEKSFKCLINKLLESRKDRTIFINNKLFNSKLAIIISIEWN